MKGNSHLDLTSLIQRMLMQRYKIQILINRLKKRVLVRMFVVSLLRVQFFSGCSSSRKCCNEQRTQQMLPKREAPQINISNEAEIQSGLTRKSYWKCLPPLCPFGNVYQQS